jgi:hypothetical protein
VSNALFRLCVAAVQHRDALERSGSILAAWDDDEFKRADENLIEAAFQYSKSLSECDRKRLLKIKLRAAP